MIDSTKARLAVGIVGTAPAGIAMASALAGAGHLLIGITHTSPADTDRVDAALPGLDALELRELLSRAELVLLAVADDELEGTVGAISEAHLWRNGQLVAHTSPHHGHSVLGPASSQGAIALAVHPAMSFSGTSLDLQRMREVFFAVSAPKVVLPIAQALVIEMGGEPVVIDEQQRAAYAEAFEVSTTFSTLVVNQAIGLLEEAGIANARGILAPSVRSAVERALADGHQPLDSTDLFDE
jgi:predicted short-subunit dehydrogenase-like oxidoreductase (DUF2520 family)